MRLPPHCASAYRRDPEATPYPFTVYLALLKSHHRFGL
jgi:hypothetical protein